MQEQDLGRRNSSSELHRDLLIVLAIQRFLRMLYPTFGGFRILQLESLTWKVRKFLDLKNRRPTCLWAANTIPIDLTSSISLVHIYVQDLQSQVRVLQPQLP